MITEQKKWNADGGWSPAAPWTLGRRAQLVLAFGHGDLLGDSEPLRQVAHAHPAAHVIGCSTAGEICDTQVSEDSLVVTAVAFQSTRIRVAETGLLEDADSAAAGARLGAELAGDDLAHILVLSDGLRVNGSDLARGLTGAVPPGVTVSGGLSADGARFARTVVQCNGSAGPGRIVAVGFYGRALRIGCGSLGGWDPFGPERRVTRARGNVLYELDGEPALGLYKRYLGEHAAGLPASGLRFPLSVRAGADQPTLVRTILATDEAAQSMTFAGDIPQNATARLMCANFDRLIDGAVGAARAGGEALGTRRAELALLISCVGRRLVLQQRTEEELEAVRAVLGAGPALTGFYSYGEISPSGSSARCELHNQTMTITALAEAA
jgi:hypothetical protein